MNADAPLPRIVAVITLRPDAASGGVPVFFARSGEERDGMALLLGKVMRAMVHDLGEGTYVLVRH